MEDALTTMIIIVVEVIMRLLFRTPERKKRAPHEYVAMHHLGSGGRLAERGAANPTNLATRADTASSDRLRAL